MTESTLRISNNTLLHLVMEFYVFIWMLLLVMGSNGGAADKCPASRGTIFTLSIASRRNLTGQWTVSVDGVMERPSHNSSANSPVEVAIDVAQRTAPCEDAEIVQLTATAVVDAHATVHGVTGRIIILFVKNKNF